MNHRGRQGDHGGKGRKGTRGRDRGRGRLKCKRDGSTFITLAEGKQVKYYPSFNLPSDVYGNVKQADNDQMKR